MLSPSLTAYRGLKLNEHILVSQLDLCSPSPSINAMQAGLRECNVAELPPNSEPLKVERVLAKIGKQTIGIRNEIKVAVCI